MVYDWLAMIIVGVIMLIIAKYVQIETNVNKALYIIGLILLVIGIILFLVAFLSGPILLID